MDKMIYALFDRRIKSVVLIKEAVNIYEFKRWFAMVFLHAGSVYQSYPDDFCIYVLGDFNTETMVCHSVTPELMCTVSEIMDQFNIARPDSAQSSDEA